MNECRFIGNLGRDPEIKCTNNGKVRATFSLAVKREYIDEKGEKHQFTDWVNIVAWGGLAEAVGNILHKGSHIMAVCRYSYRSYQDANGVKKNIHEFIATSILLSLNDVHKLFGTEISQGDSVFAVPCEEVQQEDIPF